MAWARMPFWDGNASVGKEDFKTIFIRKGKKGQHYTEWKATFSMEIPESNLSCFTETGNALQCSGKWKMVYNH